MIQYFQAQITENDKLNTYKFTQVSSYSRK